MQKSSANNSLFLGKKSFGRPFRIDYNALLAKHLLITGQTGSGKSTSAKQLVSELQVNDITNVIFDPTGEYGHDLENVVDYQLSQNAFLDVTDQSAEQLLALLDLHWESPLRAKLQSAIESLRIQAKRGQPNRVLKKVNLPVRELEEERASLNVMHRVYQMAMLPKQLVEEFTQPFADERADYTLCGQEMDHAAIKRYWSDIQELEQLLQDETLNRIFHFQPVKNQQTQYELSFILKTFAERKNKNRSLMINLAPLQAHIGIQKRVLSYLMDQLLLNRLNSDVQLPVAIFLDEAHRYLPKEQAVSENGLFHLLREGRKVNLNVVVSTQSLKDLPEELRGQFGANLVHRYQAQEELIGFGLPNRMLQKLPKLGVGQGLLLTASQRPALIQIQKPGTM